MSSLIKTYITNIERFDDDAIFNETMESISQYRRQKIEKLKNRKEKSRSMAAAAALNAALQEYGLEEKTMEYALGEHGKPYFRHTPKLYFSLSHSGDYAICSIGSHELGNDIEHARKDSIKMAERFFAKEELDWIHQADSEADAEERILRIWTMKESFMKVTGRGMSLPLDAFAALMTDDECTQIRQNIDDKTYKIKEYPIPELFKEKATYKISVCSEDAAFISHPEIIL